MSRSICLLVLASCAGVPPMDPSTCGLRIAHDSTSPFIEASLDYPSLQRELDAAFDATTTTTDVRLGDVTQLCHDLVGWQIFTVAEPSWESEVGKVGGLTYCTSRRILVGTPPDRDWRESSLVHEFMHVFQQCSTPRPWENGVEAHGNWLRDNIWLSIERVRSSQWKP